MTTETLPSTRSASPPAGAAPMPGAAARISGMVCRNCGRTQPLAVAYVCPACFGPLEVAYDLAVAGATLTREAIARRAPGIWRYLELLPVDAAPARRCPSGRRRC